MGGGMKMTDWIEWNGGECPVAEGVRGSVRMRCGKEYHDFALCEWRWNHWNDSSADIIAYRVVQEDHIPDVTKMVSKAAILEFHQGTDFPSAVDFAWNMALSHNCDVIFKFNDRRIAIEHDRTNHTREDQ
jgi:hypothetical protein